MKKGGGKGKGSQFERWVCKQLSKWVSNGRHTDLFWRSAMSGGRATVGLRRGRVVRQAGDICAVHATGHSLTDQWFIECKNYRRIDLGQWAINNQGKIKTWWARCNSDARKYGLDPMLIVKQNGWPVLVITRQHHIEHWVAPQIRVCNKSADVSLFSDLMLSKYQ